MFVLYILSVVAAGSSGRYYEDWVNRGEFITENRCMAAAEKMKLQPTKFFCTLK